MAQLRHVMVGPENENAFLEYWQHRRLPFIGLPDPNYSALKLYRQEVNRFKFVRFVHYGHDMQDIPENDEILKALEAMKKSFIIKGHHE